jgi:hypothetical protein
MADRLYFIRTYTALSWTQGGSRLGLSMSGPSDEPQCPVQKSAGTPGDDGDDAEEKQSEETGKPQKEREATTGDTRSRTNETRETSGA